MARRMIFLDHSLTIDIGCNQDIDRPMTSDIHYNPIRQNIKTFGTLQNILFEHFSFWMIWVKCNKTWNHFWAPKCIIWNKTEIQIHPCIFLTDLLLISFGYFTSWSSPFFPYTEMQEKDVYVKWNWLLQTSHLNCGKKRWNKLSWFE